LFPDGERITADMRKLLFRLIHHSASVDAAGKPYGINSPSPFTQSEKFNNALSFGRFVPQECTLYLELNGYFTHIVKEAVIGDRCIRDSQHCVSISLNSAL